VVLIETTVTDRMVYVVECLDKIRIFTIMHENKNVNFGCLLQIYEYTKGGSAE